MEKYETGSSLEPLLRNRYKFAFTDTNDVINPARVQRISLGMLNHNISIIETQDEPLLFKTIKIGAVAKYRIDFLDPTGKIVETLHYQGTVADVYMDDLKYSDDSILTTNIRFGNIE